MSEIKVFISCDTSHSKLNAQWVEQFKSSLNQLLVNALKQPASILSSFDKEASPFSQEKIKNFDAVLMLISDTYYDAQNTKNEQAVFVEDDKKTYIKLLLTEPHQQILEDGIDGTIHNLHIDDKSGRNKITDISEFHDHKEFWLRLFDIVYELSLNTGTSSKTKRATVFVAEPTPDIEREWLSLRRELLHSGYEVLPHSKYYFTKAHLEAATLDALEKSQLSVHFIGGKKGSVVNGEDVVLLQNGMAASFCNQKPELSRLIWIPNELIYADREQRISIEKLRKENTGLVGAEIVQTPVEKLKDIVHQKLRKSQSHDSIKGKTSGHTVYLLANKHQEKHKEQIENQLAANNVDILLPIASSDKRKLLEHHRKCLLSCDSVVLINDPISPDWTISKHKDIIKAAGLGREIPIQKKILVVDEEEKKFQKKFDDYQILNIETKNIGDIVQSFSGMNNTST